jgi:acetyl-CoA acetyltransferase
MTDVVIASAARTAIGSYGKGLASVPPSELVTLCIGGGQGIALLLGRYGPRRN